MDAEASKSLSYQEMTADREAATPMAAMVAAYIVAIGGAEIIAARIGVVPGLLCHALIVVALLTHFAWQRAVRMQRALLILGLLPLLRILSLTMPIEGVPRIYWYVLIGVPLLAAVFLASHLLNFTRRDLGLSSSPWPAQAAIALSGLPLGATAYKLLRPPPVITIFDWPHLVTGAIILAIFVAFVEEIIYRGMVQRAAVDIFGRGGLLWSAAVFAIMYVGSQSLAYVLFMGFVGLFFGWCVQRTGSLWGVVAAHSGLIIGLACVWPFVWL